MNVGIVVYSHTGNTLSVAEKLAQGIRASGHAVQIVRIEPVDSNLQAKPPVKLQSVPDISTFDVVVLASPIHGFTLAQAMKAYLEQLPDLEGKFIYSYVTQHLKWAWMGGNRGLRIIETSCKAKGESVRGSAVIHWSSPQRDEQIQNLVKHLIVF